MLPGEVTGATFLHSHGFHLSDARKTALGTEPQARTWKLLSELSVRRTQEGNQTPGRAWKLVRGSCRQRGLESKDQGSNIGAEQYPREKTPRQERGGRLQAVEGSPTGLEQRGRAQHCSI